MSDLEIAAGHDPSDRLSIIFDHEARPPTTDQDPAVAARCPEVFREAARLCLQFPAAVKVPGFQIFSTPRVTYRTQKGASGLIAAHTLFAGRVKDEVFVPARAKVLLHWHVSDTNWAPLFTLQPNALEYDIERLGRRGEHGDLNYFRGIIDKMRALKFQAKPLGEAEQARRAALIDAVAPLPAGPQTIVDIRDANL